MLEVECLEEIRSLKVATTVKSRVFLDPFF